MLKHPILNLPLSDVLRTEFALPLQQMMQIYTVGSFLRAWRNPKNQRSIEQVFDSPEQARHAAQTCATWLGVRTTASIGPVEGWWKSDDSSQSPA